MTRVQAAPPNNETPVVLGDAAHPEDIRWNVGTGPAPRGIIQGRFGKVWVACKGDNAETERGPRAEIRSHDFVTGRPIDVIGDSVDSTYFIRIPFGARGVCVRAHYGAEFRSNYDEIWVTCFGDQNPMDHSNDGRGNKVVRIIDNSPLFRQRPRPGGGVARDPQQVGPGRVTVIRLGSDPNAALGPFGIACSVLGDKYVACGTSGQMWKIPANEQQFLATDSHGLYLPETAVPGWPISLRVDQGGAEAPLSVAIDGNDKIWVTFKASQFNRIVRINPSGLLAPMQGIEVNRTFETEITRFGRPENLGDFTGYWTAAGLYPCDDSDAEGGGNLQELLQGSNPFVPYDLL